LAVLSFAGGSNDNTDQGTYPILLAAAAQPGGGIAPPAAATTTTSAVEALVPERNLDRFCTLAAEFSSASAAPQTQAEWEKQLQFYSIGATLVAPTAVDPVTNETWRTILRKLSDQQAEINLELASIGWELGAYHDATFSSGVVGAPAQRLLTVCGPGVDG
jgi:hypothetical protein